MKTVIIIEDGRVEIQVDDGRPIVVDAAQNRPGPQYKRPDKLPEKKTGPDLSSPPDIRKCEICQGPMAGAFKTAKVCSEECRKEKQRRYTAKVYAQKHPKKKNYQKADHLTDKIRSEIETIKPDPDFVDPWDCQRCRNVQNLCGLHQGMSDDGLKPPLGKAPGL